MSRAQLSSTPPVTHCHTCNAHPTYLVFTQKPDTRNVCCKLILQNHQMAVYIVIVILLVIGSGIMSGAAQAIGEKGGGGVSLQV